MSKSFLFLSTLAAGSLALISACAMPGDRSADHSANRVNSASAHPLSPTMVQQVQARMQQLGMYNGAIDGVWGPATEASVRNYQKSQGLVISGQLDSPTIAAMNLDGSNTQPLASSQAPLPAAGAR